MLETQFRKKKKEADRNKDPGAIFIQTTRLSFTNYSICVSQTSWISGWWWLPLLYAVPFSLFLPWIIIIWNIFHIKSSHVSKEALSSVWPVKGNVSRIPQKQIKLTHCRGIHLIQFMISGLWLCKSTHEVSYSFGRYLVEINRIFDETKAIN